MQSLLAILLVSLLVANSHAFSLSKATLLKYALQGIIQGVKDDIQKDINDIFFGKEKPKTWGETLGNEFDKLKELGNSAIGRITGMLNRGEITVKEIGPTLDREIDWTQFA